MPPEPPPDPSDATLVPGPPAAKTFASGRYAVRRILGEGGQKVVYLVHDEELDRDCALSVVRSELLGPDDLERLRREAQAMARLGAHSNIVTVFDFGQEDGKPYIVCEYVPGGELRAELRAAGGPLPAERAVAIAMDVARALVVAHARGIIHRDVKPSNVWMNEDGSAKLGDFGLAFSIDRTRMTLPGSAMGTATYMAPEQARGEPADARTDLYALGVMLYEMVCGRPPFSGDDPLSVISQHASVAPVAPALRIAGLPPALNDLILRLLAKPPDARPASAAVVLEALRAIAAPKASTSARSAVPRGSRTRRLVAVASLVVIAGVALAVTLVFVLRDTGPVTDTSGASAPLAAEGYVPALEPRDCPDELTSDPAVLCHDLVVPETRSEPAGRQIRIFVMVAPSNVQPAGAPTVFLGGALGTSNYFLGGGVFSQPAGSDVRDYGDVVVAGVRGRQFSQPMPTCPEVSGLRRELLVLPMNGEEANNLWLDAAERCGRRLVSEGFDLNVYGQDEIVKDVRDLAIAMAWRQINVEARYDLSRTATLLAARYPGLVRSLVLDAPFPADATWYSDRLGNFHAALEAYYAACRADPGCERAFPNLEQAAPAIYAQSQQDPAVIRVPDPTGGPDLDVLLNGDRFAYILALGLTGQEQLSRFAGLLVSEGESAPRTAAAAVVVIGGDPYGDPSVANFSAYCQDLDQHVLRFDLEAAEVLYPLFRMFAHEPLFELCLRWPTAARSRALGPLETASAVPALILTGALNPYAPPAYAERAANAFTHATVAVFPSLTAFSLGTAQTLTSGPPCIAALRLAFLRDPKAKLDADIARCIAQVPPIVFVGT